jgi:hypothetical protein
MNLLAFLVLGAVVDLLSRALLPGLAKETASLITGADLAKVDSTNLVGSLAGALAVLTVTLLVGRRVGA